MPKKGSKIIRWDASENAKVALAYISQENRYIGSSKVDLAYRGQQEALPKERWRNRPSLQMWTSSGPFRRHIQNARKLVAEKPDVLLGETPAIPPEAPAPNHVSTPEQRIPTHMTTPEPAPLLGEQMRDWVVGVLTDVVFNVLEHPIVKAYISSPNPRNIDVLDWLKRANPEAIGRRHNPYPTVTERKDKPIILIIGLKPSQRHRFWERYGKMFELRFWYDEGAPRLQERAKNAWKVIATMGATSHSSMQALASIKVDVQRVTGGDSGITNALDELLPEAYPELRAATEPNEGQ